LATPDPALSLYLHVPFCTDKCLYCDFFSVPHRTVTPAVTEAMVGETVRLARRLVESAGPSARVQTIFVGGGTPSCLPPAQLDALLGAFAGTGCAEWTVESNPETLSESFLDSCRRAGVTRLSVGIQSLDSRHLATLRRHATREQALAAIELVKKHWAGELNLDFITGIPGQSVADVREDLSVIEDGWPDHVSLYQLTVEPGTPLEKLAVAGRMVLNRPELDEELWLSGREELIRKGCLQYEVSNFARPGRECRHNVHYWRLDPYVGAGPGAVSTLPPSWAARAAKRPELAARAQSVVRFAVPRDIRGFLRGEGSFWGIETEIISPADFLLECVMMGLRLSGGIPDSVFRRRFGRGFGELFPGLWEGWVDRGLAAASTDTLSLSPEGLLVLDRLLADVLDLLPAAARGGLSLSWPQSAVP
jgi:oxygen-independent coproporphyrinogen-3 oxidase